MTGNDPIDSDSDDDKVRDGAENAGVVASFGNGVLTIDLADGRRISGGVDEFTDVECDSERAIEARRARHARRRAGHRRGRGATRGARSSQSDEGGEGDEPGEEGDERGDEGDEPGDEGDGDDEADDRGDDGAQGGNCTTADLVPGARVHAAEVIVTAGGPEFAAIELLR